MEVRESTIEGAGLGTFATRDISKGETLCEYDGFRFEHESMLMKKEEAYVYSTTKDINIVPYKSCKARYINDIIDLDTSIVNKSFTSHYCLKHNVKFHEVEDDKGIEHAYIVALRNIKEGDELFIAYGKGYWNFFIKKSKRKLLAEYIEENHCGDLSDFINKSKREYAGYFDDSCSFPKVSHKSWRIK